MSDLVINGLNSNAAQPSADAAITTSPHSLAGRPSYNEPPQRADCICWSRCRLPGAASCRATPSGPHVALSGDLGGGGLCFMKTLNMICARAAARPVSDKQGSQPA